MSTLIQSFGYPWTLPEARELHTVLFQLYPSSVAAIFPAQAAGIHQSQLSVTQPAYVVWMEILEKASTQGTLKTLLERVIELNPNSPKRPFLEAILQGKEPEHDAQPRGAMGVPTFVDGDDVVSDPEALLYHDDLTLSIGRVPWLIDVLGRIQKLAPAVCRLAVSRAAKTQSGTGFRIGPDLLLTNWHVVTVDGQPATSITAEFGFEEDANDAPLPSTLHPCDLASIQSHEKHDWAVVKVTKAIPAGTPTLKLSEAVDPEKDEPAFIVQHPAGARKRLAYTRNQITGVRKHVLHYLSDTQVGSSGAPVLNAGGLLIGLHHAGGRPQEVAGKPPVVKNEGIRIPTILDDLAKAGIQVP